MSQLPTTTANKYELALIQGDLSKLNSEEKISYYNQVCESLGLNNLTKPFEYMRLNGREVLYATKNACEQLRQVHKIGVTITSRSKVDDIYLVTAKAKIGDREDESIGAVSIAGLKGEGLANAIMKAETKAKRRVTLSICSLGMLDETEVETIKDAVKIEEPKPIDTKPKENDETIIETQKQKEQEAQAERELKLKIWSQIKLVNEKTNLDLNKFVFSLFGLEFKDLTPNQFDVVLTELKKLGGKNV